jgi:hypothetical protein
MIKVYAESSSHAELWAIFYDESTYMDCLPVLIAKARGMNMIITESNENYE